MRTWLSCPRACVGLASNAPGPFPGLIRDAPCSAKPPQRSEFARLFTRACLHSSDLEERDNQIDQRAEASVGLLVAGCDRECPERGEMRTEAI